MSTLAQEIASVPLRLAEDLMGPVWRGERLDALGIAGVPAVAHSPGIRRPDPAHGRYHSSVNPELMPREKHDVDRAEGRAVRHRAGGPAGRSGGPRGLPVRVRYRRDQRSG